MNASSVGLDHHEADSDYPEEAARWRRLTYLNENGQIPSDALIKANRQREENLAYWQQPLVRQSPAISSSSWIRRGPENIGGRTRALVVHPSNPSVLWAGAVGGGVWKSTNAGTSWVPLDDFMPSIAVGCLTIDPANPAVLYCGTGEGYFNTDAIDGAGIFKTTDGGTSWNRLPSTAGWNMVNRIAIAHDDSNLMLAGMQSGGIMRSTNGGATCSNVNNRFTSYQVAFDPTDHSKAIASVSDGDPHNVISTRSALYSTDAGATWQPSNLSNIQLAWARIELAYAPSAPNIVYANVDTSDGGKVWRSTDAGQTYTKMTTSAQTGANTYDNALWVSPVDPDLIVAGGAALYRSTDAGVSFNLIAYGGTLTQEPHADMHLVISDPGFDGVTNKRVYVCNDGGIFRTDDILTAAGSNGWTNLNAMYTTTQYYGADGHGTTSLIIGGTQDNGTTRSPFANLNATLLFPGDGGVCAVDPDNDTYCYGEYVGLQLFRSQDRGLSAQFIYSGLADAGNNALFVAPFTLDPNDSNRMFAGGISLWRSNNVRLGNPPDWLRIKPPGSAPISAIAVATGDSNNAWVAQATGEIFKSSNALSDTPTWTAVDDNQFVDPLPNRFPTRILIDPSDSNLVYVTFGGFADGNIQRSTNAGATWTDISGAGPTGLPLAPIRGIARNPINPSWLYVGTEIGVFTSEDGGANWSTTNQGPSSTVVDELVFMHHSTILLAATHGRGLWTQQTGCVSAFSPASASFAAQGGSGTIAVNGGAACSWVANRYTDWINIVRNRTGTGSAIVEYSVSPNTSASPRSSIITISAETFTVYQGAQFSDVQPGDPFYEEIGKLSARGVTLGCGDGLYCPNDPVLREQMAAFIMRAKGEFNPAAPASQRFGDVPPSNQFYNFIERLAQLGITLGCQPGNPPLYCPSDAVKREQMSAFILRGLGEFNPPTPAMQRFGDVPPSNDFYNFIDRLAVLQITLGCQPGNPPLFCPNDNVTRGQMAAFLVRAFNL